MSEEKNIHTEIITRALRDDNFKKNLKENPVETIKKNFGIEIPEGIDIKIIEDTDILKHIVIPHVHNHPIDIDDRELDLVVGGSNNTYEYTVCFGPWYACV